jgi:2-C-methyl-D-erythritol 4-phosphate cytidylyltransferase
MPGHEPRYVALLPAAGVGARMEADTPKQYLPILGRPMLWHALRVFERAPRIVRIHVILSPQDVWWSAHDWRGFDKLSVLRCGGASRAETVLNGLDAIAGDCDPDDWVLVHDAARPCLSDAMLARLMDALAADPVGGLLAVPVADTLKRALVDADRCARAEATVPRAGLWQAQTPQMFRHGLLSRALRAAGSTVTDEASAIERLGLRPRLIESDARNLKVTYPPDIELAGLILGCGRT